MAKKLKRSKLASAATEAAPRSSEARPVGATQAGQTKRPHKLVVKAKGKKGAGRLVEALVSPKPRKRTGGVAATLSGSVGQSLAKLASRRRTLGTLERLEIAIDEVRLGGRESPRTRRLLSAGLPKMAQKLIEEAGEAAIEAVRADPGALINETADLFYNALVLLRGAGIPLAAVWQEMDRREVALGMAEKLPKAVDPEA